MFSVLKLKYFVYGLIITFTEICLLLFALIVMFLSAVQISSNNYVVALEFVIIAIVSWYLFEYFHTANIFFTYDIYNLLSKIFYSLLALRMFFLTVIATYSIISVLFALILSYL